MMITKEDVMKILDLDTADYDTLTGLSELQRRADQAYRLLTEDKIRTATDRLSGENAAPPLDVLSDIEDCINAKRTILKDAKIDITPIAWEDIDAEDRRKWLIPYWLPENTVTMFTGQGGAGKSWLTLQIICQIAAGFGQWASLNPDVSPDADPSPTCNVILATYEDEPAEIKRRLYTLEKSFDWIKESLPAIKQNFHIVDMRGVGSIWGPGTGYHIANTGDLLPPGEQLQRICEDKKASLLIIDPLSGAFGGNENDRTAVYDFISAMRKWGDTAKCAILTIGHLPKGKEAKEAGFSGSTAWEASARSMWMLRKKQDEESEYYELSHTKSNYAPIQPPKPLIKNLHGWWKQAKDVEVAINGFKEYEKAIKSTQQEKDNENDKIPVN